MVIEFLTFDVDIDDQQAWSVADRETWTDYLSGVPGFVRKEVWVDRDEPNRVHAVVWWRDDASWAACDVETMRAVDAAMGPLHRAAILRTFDAVATHPDPT